MKKFKKATALLLTIILIASCFSVTSFAATKETVKQFGAEKDALYLSLGDSISRGAGLNEKDDERYTSTHSFVAEIATATGYNFTSDKWCVLPDTGNFKPCNYNGLSVEGVLTVLGLAETNNFMNQMQGYNKMLDQFGTNAKTPLSTQIEKANLITIELGMSDILVVPVQKSLYELGIDQNNIQWSDVNAITVPQFLNKFTTYSWKNYYAWKVQYPKLLKYIKDHNKNNATVVIIGANNPIRNVSLTEDSLVRLGDLISSITAAMNVCYKQWAKDFGFEYADISTISSGAGVNNWDLLGEEFWDNTMQATHPIKESQETLTNAVLNVLPEKDAQTMPDNPNRTGLLKHIKAVTKDYHTELTQTPTITNIKNLIEKNLILRIKK